MPPPLSIPANATNLSYNPDHGDVVVVAAGGPGYGGPDPNSSKRVGGEAWFARAREHMDEVRVIWGVLLKY